MERKGLVHLICISRMEHNGLVHLIFIAVFLSLLQQSYTKQCISNSSSISDQGPRFTSPYIHLDYVRFGHATEILCCGINYDSIDWYKLKDNNWEKLVPCKELCHDDEPTTDERGQVVRIISIDSSSNTSFKCVLNKKDFPSVDRITQIFVVSCDELPRGPIATIKPLNQDIFSFGGDVTFQCEGYFGCDYFRDYSLLWYIQDPSSGIWSWIQGNETKLILQEYNRLSGTILGANLTVHSVQPQDLGRKYLCAMASPQEVDSTTSFIVQINKKDCDELSRGPIATIKPLNQDIFSFGGDVTFQCEGYFGCDNFRDYSLSWSIQDPSSGIWSWIQGNETKLILQEYNRLSGTILGANLTVHSVQPEDIGRKYLCAMASPQPQPQEVDPRTSFIVQINKKDCDELSRGPIATIKPLNQDIFSFGGDVTFQCEGYFGCDNFRDYSLSWSIQDPSSGIWSWIQGNETKLILQEYNRLSGTILGANLTVHSVQPQDIGRKYLCAMASSQEEDPITSFIVQINKKDPPVDKWTLIGICVGVALGSVILIGLIIWIVWYCCGPQIKLRIRQALPYGFIGPKTLDDEKYEYNAILYHADEDTQKAEKIKEDLEKHGWKIKISADILESKSMLMESFKYCEKSALVMFLYTDNLRNDRMANVIFEVIIEVKKNKKILVIEINNKIKKSFMEWFKSAKDRKKVQRQNNEVHNGGHGVEIEGEEEENIDQAEGNLGLLQTDFWKGVSTIKWNKNHENKVLCQIQNKLPKLKYQVQMEKKMKVERKSAHNVSVGSQKPLLSQNRGVFAIMGCSTPPVTRPGSDCVFFVEEEEINNSDQNPENLPGRERVNEDLLAEVHVDGHPKIPMAADTDICHIVLHEGDLANHDVHDSQNSLEDQQPGQNPRAEYRPGKYGESPATSGYDSMEASGSKSLESSNENNEENYKEDLGQQLSSNRQQTSHMRVDMQEAISIAISFVYDSEELED